VLRSPVALAAVLWAADALSQVSGSVALLSDYRFRGISLTGNRPALQATVVYDHPGGAYAGLFASNVRLDTGTSLQGIGFAGYAMRLADRFDIDVGASWSGFSGRQDVGYGEIHAGAAYQGFTARLSYAPTYFGEHEGAWYFEASGTYALGGPFSALAHAGVLRRESGAYAYYETARTVGDARLGIGARFDGTSVRLEWVGISTLGYAYPVAGDQRRNSVVLSVTRSF
jgi:uncharacterized protein (TIGR02001 family)